MATRRLPADPPMTRVDIERRANPADRVMLEHASPYVVFRYALDRGWITQAQHDDARDRSGHLWNYAGD